MPTWGEIGLAQVWTCTVPCLKFRSAIPNHNNRISQRQRQRRRQQSQKTKKFTLPLVKIGLYLSEHNLSLSFLSRVHNNLSQSSTELSKHECHINKSLKRSEKSKSGRSEYIPKNKFIVVRTVHCICCTKFVSSSVVAS